MPKLFPLLRRTALILLGALVPCALAARLGPWKGWTAWAAVMAIACPLAALLLRTAPIGRITWRNRLASYALSWGCRLGRGRLVPTTLIAWLVWLLIGAAAVLLFAGRAGAPRPTLACLFAAWVLHGSLILRQLGFIVSDFRNSPRGRLTMLQATLAMLALLALSLTLWLRHRPGWALLVAGGPLALVGAAYAIFAGAMILFGRKARWN